MHGSDSNLLFILSAQFILKCERNKTAPLQRRDSPHGEEDHGEEAVTFGLENLEILLQFCKNMDICGGWRYCLIFL